MSTDAFGGKNEAKEIISRALWGFALAIGAWMILYTISPGENNPFVNFNLSLERQEIPENQNTPSSGGVPPSASGARCQGDCPYSYINAQGVEVRYRDCLDCANSDTFNLNIRHRFVDGRQTMINRDLGSALRTVRQTSGNPDFYITETWPPTVNHASQDQYDGTSVDVGLVTRSATNIAAFINNATAQGLRVVYEVRTESERQTYINNGVPASNIITVPYITGEHFSVYRR